jgi:hypothetical protein
METVNRQIAAGALRAPDKAQATHKDSQRGVE